jgi:hypothetical protein
MSVAIPVADRIRALRESMEEAAKTVRNWSETKRESADVTIQTRSLASLYESQIPCFIGADRAIVISETQEEAIAHAKKSNSDDSSEEEHSPI